jgi:hypothetical protein
MARLTDFHRQHRPKTVNGETVAIQWLRAELQM